MAAQQFVISDRNPNPGGGCICDRSRQVDCKPPFAIFQGNTMLSSQSPHVVLCKTCAELAVRKMDEETPVAAGETEGASLPAPLKHVERTDEGVKI